MEKIEANLVVSLLSPFSGPQGLHFEYVFEPYLNIKYETSSFWMDYFLSRFGFLLCTVMLNTGPQGLVAPKDERMCM